jgi:hypothetical protein
LILDPFPEVANLARSLSDRVAFRDAESKCERVLVIGTSAYRRTSENSEQA